MNKKLLLSLGAPILTVLPFAAMVSCSAEVNLTTEKEKFNITVQTKDKNLLAWDSARTIEDATTQEDKLRLLEAFADVPKISEGFKAVIDSAWVDPDYWSTIKVSFKISETANPDSETITYFTVEGFKIDPIEIEVAKFKNSKPTIASISAAEAVQRFHDVLMPVARLEVLKTLVDVPSISSEFELGVLRVDISPGSDKSIDAVIKISSIAIPEKAVNVTFKITGFLPSF
ncbi:MAG: hypothetical protein ACRCXE_01385 [Metamycoplasmataceae bacterium]